MCEYIIFTLIYIIFENSFNMLIYFFMKQNILMHKNKNYILSALFIVWHVTFLISSFNKYKEKFS